MMLYQLDLCAALFVPVVRQRKNAVSENEPLKKNVENDELKRKT
jgi:hypothetical protein